MKRFVFSLEKVRDYKEQVLDKEKLFLGELLHERNELQHRASELAAYMNEKRAALQRQQEEGICLADILPIRFLIEAAEQEYSSVLEAQAHAEQAIATQRKKLIEISREITGLDKLEEKKRQDYAYQVKKEAEELVLENVSLQVFQAACQKS